MDAKQSSGQQNTFLIVAAHYGHASMVRLLLDKEAGVAMLKIDMD